MKRFYNKTNRYICQASKKRCSLWDSGRWLTEGFIGVADRRPAR